MKTSRLNNKTSLSKVNGNKATTPSMHAKVTNCIENHVKAAQHFSLASSCHYEAAMHQEEGDDEKAKQLALVAIGHASLAKDYQILEAKQQALKF